MNCTCQNILYQTIDKSWMIFKLRDLLYLTPWKQSLIYTNFAKNSQIMNELHSILGTPWEWNWNWRPPFYNFKMSQIPNLRQGLCRNRRASSHKTVKRNEANTHNIRYTWLGNVPTGMEMRKSNPLCAIRITKFWTSQLNHSTTLS